MKKIEMFTNQYALSKTLQFSLIPVGETEQNFEGKLLLEEDEKRAESYQKVKGLIDRYHKDYIERRLNCCHLSKALQVYADLYEKPGRTEKETDQLRKAEETLRKEVARHLQGISKEEKAEYKALFGADMICTFLPRFLTDAEELQTAKEFEKFTTYFTGFYTNRENMYTEDEKGTSIAYRCIHENLPKFLDNRKNYARVKEALPAETWCTLEKHFPQINDMFAVEQFEQVLSQSGIDTYNQMLGGYITEDGNKIQGLNEAINLYNQQYAKKNHAMRLPLFKPLFKQILSDRISISFIPEKITEDTELLHLVQQMYQKGVKDAVEHLQQLFAGIDQYEPSGIYLVNGAAVTDLSQRVFGSWNALPDAWKAAYEAQHPIGKKDPEPYSVEVKRAYQKVESFSITELQQMGEHSLQDDAGQGIVQYLQHTVPEVAAAITEHYAAVQQLLTEPYCEEKKLASNKEAVALLKAFLDSLKDFERMVKPWNGSGKEADKDDVFYGEFLPPYQALTAIDLVYDKVRNYLTQKPYTRDKIKLNFENPQLLGGWDESKERDYRTVLLRRDGLYYLAIMDKSDSKIFMQTDSLPTEKTVCYEKMEYKLLPGPNKMLPKVFFAKSNADLYQPSAEILNIRATESFKKGDHFNLADCHKMIDFYKQSIAKNHDWDVFQFQFSPTESYADISAFYKEVEQQGYAINFKPIPMDYIDEKIREGKLYLFQIYNKDFSPYSKGTPNLHTLYFKMLFDQRNLDDVVYKLNGGAEMFYRKASIKPAEQVVHPANQPIKNKNLKNTKEESVFAYDLVKDKRYTRRQFSLHVPITLNFKAPNARNMNLEVRKALKAAEETYVIGIDRGERNLIYLCVVNSQGQIVEQKSLNEIVGDQGYTVDYHALLDQREKDRDKARKSWDTIATIKELKEGYLSQVVHEICRLVVKYDAVIAMEDLNTGFKNSRVKVEKQVYQKFETMLKDKLNYLVDKKIPPTEPGGLLHAYQLTNQNGGGLQDGFIFYVPAWLTSKIDPTTGFVDLLKPRYTSVAAAQEFVSRFQRISYNAAENMFEFTFNYDDFQAHTQDFRKQWTICSNGERIRSFRNASGVWEQEIVVLTTAFQNLFAAYQIPQSEDMKPAILAQTEKDFFSQLIYLLRLTLQMRNSMTGCVDVDYLISPVRNQEGTFYDSRDAQETLPKDADANGAYHIARKALWAIEKIKQVQTEEDLKTVKLAVTNKEWLRYMQEIV